MPKHLGRSSTSLVFVVYFETDKPYKSRGLARGETAAFGRRESGDKNMRIYVRRILTVAAAAVLTAGQVCTALAYGPGDYYYRGGPGVDPYYNENAYYSGGPGVGEGNAKETSGDTIYAYPGWNTNVPDTTQYTYDPWEWWDNDDEDWDDDDWWYYNNGPGGVYGQGWRYSPGGWWFQLYGGSWLSDGWKMIRNRWYRFDGSGYMVTGWFTDGDGNRYYLNPVDDGTLGMMRTGWQVIDGKSYYFNTQSDGTMGRLYVDTVTPDGYRVGADGAMIQ